MANVPQKGNWFFFDTAFVRSTGFPFSLLTQFRFTKTLAGFDEIWKLSQSAENLADELFRLLETHRTGREKYVNKLRKSVADKRPITIDESFPDSTIFQHWNAVLSELETAMRKGKETFESELLDKRGKLRELLQTNQAFREAMFLSSNGSSEIAVGSYLKADIQKRNTDIRQYERLFISYLQRFCTKNETTSFFGPINYGKLNPQSTRNLTFATEPGKNGKKILRNAIFFSHWAAQALSNAYCELPEIRPYVAPRLSSFYRFSNDRLLYFGMNEKEISSAAKSILRHVDGNRTFGEIRRDMRETSNEEFWTVCNELAASNIITNSFTISHYSENGVADLLHFLSCVPPGATNERWKESLERLEKLRAEFHGMPYPNCKKTLEEAQQLFESLSGNNAKRGEGQFYTDRSIFFEECRGLISQCELSGEVLSRITGSVSEVLNVMALLSIAVWEYWQFIARKALERLLAAKKEKRILLNEFWVEFEDEYDEVSASGEAQALERNLKEIFLLADERNPKKIKEALKKSGLLHQDEYPLCASIDVLIAAKTPQELERGIFTLYLGEIHPDVFLTNCYFSFLYFYDERDKYMEKVREAWDALAGPNTILQAIFRRTNRLFQSKMSGSALFIQETYTGESDIVPLALWDLEVVEKNGKVMLKHVSDGRTFVMLPFDLFLMKEPLLSVFKIFSIPQICQSRDWGTFFPFLQESIAEHSPRIAWNEIVYRRESWQLTESDLKGLAGKGGFELFWEAFRLKKRLALPNCVFVRHPNELKPLLLDFENLFLVETFQHLVRGLPKARLIEFAPGEDELWLELDGEKHCSEFRLGAYTKWKPDG